MHGKSRYRKWSLTAKPVPKILTSIPISIAIAIGGGFLIRLFRDVDNKISLVGAIALAVLSLMLFELRERAHFSRLISIYEKCRGDNWLMSRIEEIVESYGSVKDSGDQLFQKTVKDQIIDAIAEISQNASGQIIVSPLQEASFTIGLVDWCNESMRAISVQDEAWWASPLGQEYLGRHKQAIERGVTIKRIFVMPESTENRRQLTDEMAKQKSLGIQVRAVESFRLLPEQRTDLVICDNRYVRHGEAIGDTRTARLSKNPDDISKASDAFEDAWLRAYRDPDKVPDGLHG